MVDPWLSEHSDRSCWAAHVECQPVVSSGAGADDASEQQGVDEGRCGGSQLDLRCSKDQEIQQGSVKKYSRKKEHCIGG